MDSETSQPSSSVYVLPKGQACITCRRRKVRCGGEKPICIQCIRSRRQDDCEYTGAGRSTIEILEQNIAQLEARIRELENPNDQELSESVKLYHPYVQSPREEGSESQHDETSSSLLHLPLPSPQSFITASQGNVQNSFHVSPQQVSGSWWTSENTPLDILEIMLDNFIPFASDFGFFLHVPRFRSSALLPYPIGHPNRPSRFLMSTVSLWGIHLSTSDSLNDIESAFLSRTLTLASAALSDEHPSKVMHALQGEVLLSYYFFRTGRFLEGKYHSSAAASLVLSSGLHQLRAPRSAGHLGISIINEPLDAIEEGERIRGFWSYLILDQSWSVILATSVNLPCDRDDPLSRIDSPWPLDVDAYEQASLASLPVSNNTVNRFLSEPLGYLQDGLSSMETHAKASILYKRATDFAKEWRPDSNSIFLASIQSFDDFVLEFRKHLPSPNLLVGDFSSTTIRTMVVAHSLAHMSTIQLHKTPFTGEESKSKQVSLLAAQAIVEIIDQVDMSDFVFINPIMKTVWATAADVFIAEISRLNSPPARGTDTTALKAAVEKITSTMTGFAIHCPLMKYQLSRLNQSYAAALFVEHTNR